MHMHTCTTHPGERNRERQRNIEGPIQEFQHLTNWSLQRKKGENGEKEFIKKNAESLIQAREHWKIGVIGWVH